MRISDWSSDVCSSDLIVTGFPSKRKAKKAAIEECRKRGGEDCSISIIYTNQCAAAVSNSVMSSSANAPTMREAIETGMQTCNEIGTACCAVYWSGCRHAWMSWSRIGVGRREVVALRVGQIGSASGRVRVCHDA